VVLEFHDELQRAIEDNIDVETDAAAQERLRESFAIQPEDHLYDPLTDKGRREKIEAGLEPMDIADMVFMGHVSQDVALGNGIVLTLRSLSTQHGLWIEWHIATTPEGSVQHTRHLFSIMQLAAGLDAVNGKSTGPDLSRFTEENQRDMFIEGLKKRMAFIGRMPQELTNDFIVQNVWFSGRLRKLLAGNLMEKVGNS
jgi:hypothetical protein